MEVLFGEFCTTNVTKHSHDDFSTGTGLECNEIAGPVRWLWMSGSFASPMPKSVLSCGREDLLLRE